jgi:hypothetical protein
MKKERCRRKAVGTRKISVQADRRAKGAPKTLLEDLLTFWESRCC